MLYEEYYRPAAPKIIHETIDGEVVMINMDKGYYYNLDRTGSIIWNLLDRGTAVSQISQYLDQQFIGEPAEIADSLYHFIGQLLEEELIETGRADGALAATGSISDSNSNGQEKSGFVVPELHKYTDMEDLLLLDPIHEVDETGWPALPEDA